MNLLHIDSSILGQNSVSRNLSAQIVSHLKARKPELVVVERDLAEKTVPHLSGAYLMAAQTPGGEHEPTVTSDLAMGSAVLQEFLSADIVVIGVPTYNFTIPSQLKTWIDRVLIVGQTFEYGEDGNPRGLAGNKRVILAIARGGLYGPGTPSHAFEHAESYLRVAFGFVGVTDLSVVIAEGLAMGPDHHKAAIDSAEKQIGELVA